MYIPDRACKGNSLITTMNTKNLQASSRLVTKLYMAKIQGLRGKNIRI